MKLFVTLIFCLFFLTHFAQVSNPKQTNVTGKDVAADAPWRMKKAGNSGNINGIPVHIFIKDANLTNCNADLIYLNIYIKNATDTSFGNPILFNTYSDSAFLSLFSAKSYTDAALDVQSFDASLPVKDSTYSIQFTSDYSWLDATNYVKVNHQFWYFTITIPPEKLVGFNDIVDIKVYFSLDWETDDEIYLRVFRNDNDLPELPGWRRGDAHYHTMYTNNSAEYGFPLASTKEVAKAIGLDWISSTNHSCDYDNYGTSMKSNWNRETAEIQALNSQDSSMLFIHGMEASVKNSAGNCIHMLSYPSNSSPYSMPYLCDGKGDLTATSVTIDNLLDSLSKYGGFSYAAHPFAGGDKLSSLISGGIWNINDTSFLANGSQMPGHDAVICNDLSVASDLYSPDSIQELFKSNLKGGQIWNYRNTLATSDEKMNPWNVTYDNGITALALYDSANTTSHYNRFLQGLEVSKFLNKKGLEMKNNNNDLLNYKFFMSAGSDAHGDFNYCNTNFVYGVTGDVSDAVIGMPSTLVYCPSGMGNAGSNVLTSLENGNVIFSDGPLVSLGISTDGNNNTLEYIIGQEALPNASEYLNAKVRIDLATTAEFGTFKQLKFIAGTRNGEHTLLLPIDSSLFNHTYVFNLDSLLQQVLAGDSIQENEYFYLRAELSTFKNYNSLSSVYKKSSETFNCYTNPVWIRKPSVVITDLHKGTSVSEKWNVFPNPFSKTVSIEFYLQSESGITIQITDFTGKTVYDFSNNYSSGYHDIKLNPELKNGVYVLMFRKGTEINYFKLIKVS